MKFLKIVDVMVPFNDAVKYDIMRFATCVVNTISERFRKKLKTNYFAWKFVKGRQARKIFSSVGVE